MKSDDDLRALQRRAAEGHFLEVHCSRVDRGLPIGPPDLHPYTAKEAPPFPCRPRCERRLPGLGEEALGALAGRVPAAAAALTDLGILAWQQAVDVTCLHGRRALAWFEKAAVQGCPQAAFNAACLRAHWGHGFIYELYPLLRFAQGHGVEGATGALAWLDLWGRYQTSQELQAELGPVQGLRGTVHGGTEYFVVGPDGRPSAMRTLERDLEARPVFLDGWEAWFVPELNDTLFARVEDDSSFRPFSSSPLAAEACRNDR